MVDHAGRTQVINVQNHRLAANAIRMLSVDAIERAQSGHPGMPLGMADIAATLWLNFMQHAPQAPQWINRDRFVVSNGHGSMLLYALLHLSGYDVTTEDLQQFRQLHSRTPGHPEFGETPGVDTTTGPLGQGLANAVGMAIAEKTLAAQYNKPDHTLIDHFTYVFAGDGCLMEGVSHESCSLAGTLGLGKLLVFWDDNDISIDGYVHGWCKDDVPKRFRSYGWDVVEGVDGHDPQAIHRAIVQARADTSRPTLIACKTMIAYGAPTLAGSAKAHGAPLGAAEVAALRQALDWPHAPFDVPASIRTLWDARDAGESRHAAWQERWHAYETAHAEAAATLSRRLHGRLPPTFKTQLHAAVMTDHPHTAVATRKASAQFLAQWAPTLPELLGGSADLTCSNLTAWPEMQALHECASGQYLYYGVREFGMFAIMNGLALYGGFIPFGGTFLTFVDYGRNAVRMAALMRQKVIFVLTHDSVGLGEDGPTHQPVEHLAMLRATPQVEVWRPCDVFETHIMWGEALSHQGPSCLALSRQTLPSMAHDVTHIEGIARGGYILYAPTHTDDMPPMPEAILIATGSEVALAVQAAEKLAQSQHHVRVVSMPCLDRFAAQDQAYQDQVLPPTVTKRVAVEAGATMGWWRWVGTHGRVLGIDCYGVSAPGTEVFEHLGITEQAIIDTLETLLAPCQQPTE